MARAYHQLGLVHLALPYYQKVLNTVTPADASAEGLPREAAYNVSLIYRASGNSALAASVMRQYLTI